MSRDVQFGRLFFVYTRRGAPCVVARRSTRTSLRDLRIEDVGFVGAMPCACPADSNCPGVCVSLCYAG